MRIFGKLSIAILSLFIVGGFAVASAAPQTAAQTKQAAAKAKAKADAQRRSEKVAALLAANPRGGEKLENALATLVIGDVEYAEVIARASTTASPEQQQSMGTALGRAEAVLIANNSGAVSRVTVARSYSSPSAQQAAQAALLIAENPSAPIGGGSGGGGGSGNQFVLTPTTSGGSGGGSTSQ